MMVLDGQPAVIGGTYYSDKWHTLKSIEVYDIDRKTWKTHSVALLADRCYFGLAQVVH